MRYFTFFSFFFFVFVFEIWCVFYTYSTSQFTVVALQMLNSHMLPVATTLDSATIDYKPLEVMNCVLYFATSVIFWFYIFNNFYHLTLLCDYNSQQCRFISIKRKEKTKENRTIQWSFFKPHAVWQHIYLNYVYVGLKQKADIWSFLKA